MSKRTLESTMAEDQKVEESSKKGESASKSESKDNSNNNSNNNNNNNSEVECDQPPKKRQRQSASGEGESQDNTIANMSKSGFPGALSLFENDGLWDSLNSEMNQMNQRMNAMAQHMESRMQQSFAQMEKEMNEEMKKAAAAEAEAVSSNENDDNSKSHFHSFETHSFYDSNGHRVSHARSHEKRSDGKESIKEEKRIGNKRRLTQKSRNNDKSEWNIEEKTENIGDNQQAMLEFESTFDRIFGKKENKQKAIENKK